MQIIKYPEKSQWKEILCRPVLDLSSLYKSVDAILMDVKERGDKAVIDYSWQFDKVRIKEIAVSHEEIISASNAVSGELKNAIQIASANIKTFHQAQAQTTLESQPSPGVRCWQKSVAIEKVGLYIPGGTAPLISTVLMLAIPASIAGCREVILCSPPNLEGNIHPAILYAADLNGINKIYKVGGAQAIAAMAYGTETIPAVFKIFGPGNQYVQAAKAKVSIENTAIDMPAGPSELAVMADDSAVPAFIASDLLSQAEHGVDSQVLLVTKSEKLINEVEKELQLQLAKLPRKAIASRALENSRMILLRDEDAMVEIINEYAPEHLIIATENYSRLANRIVNAGSVFLGNYSPESAGDYASGTNHTLPTNGHARAYSGVNLDSFMKKISYQELSYEGLAEIGSAIETLAEAEQLQAHKNAVSIRLSKSPKY